MEVNHYIRSAALSAAGLSDVGQVRKANEDSCGYTRLPYGDVFVTCDGMGGHVGGATASRTAVDAIIARMSLEVAPASIPEVMAAALSYANDQVLGTAEANPSLRGMGTTACVVVVQDGQAWIGHVGDSRIYLFDGNTGVLHRITRDHSLVQQLVDDGELDDREAEHHPQKNIILSAIGIREHMKAEVEPQPVKLMRGDRILICSDGLSGMVDDNEIEAVLRSNADTAGTVAKLMNMANAPGKGRDNITIQLVDVLEGNNAARQYKDYNPKWRKQASKTVTVGRADDNSFVLSRAQVSKHHLEIKQQGETVTVRDLGSLNGTFVNGVRIHEEKRLLPGDRITVDSVELPWETWFNIPRSKPVPAPQPHLPAPDANCPKAAGSGEREEVRRRVEAKLDRLKQLINNK